MLDKFNRSNYSPLTSVNGLSERDMLLTNWDLFETKRGFVYDYLTVNDMQAPDLLSFRIYGRMDWWWILSKFNNIDDWWNDVSVGMRIKVPKADDILDFYSNTRKRL